MTPSGGLATTMEVLTKSKNDSAVNVLVAALDSPDDEVRGGALRALLRRRSRPGHQEILSRWNDLDKEERNQIREYPRRFTRTLRELILKENVEFGDVIFEAATFLGEYDLLPALVSAAEQPDHALRDKAVEAVLLLCRELHDELTGNSDVSDRHLRPEQIRRNIITVLEASVQRYQKHECREILQSFLLLTGRENSILRLILNSPSDHLHAPLIKLIRSAEEPGILRLLVSFLEDTTIPWVILDVIRKRTDLPFLRRLLGRYQTPIPDAARGSLRKIENLAFLSNLNVLEELEDRHHEGAVEIVMASHIPRMECFDVLKYMLHRGKPKGRRAAANHMQEFHGFDANRLVEMMLNDSDPQVVAIAASQLRSRGIAAATTKLISLVDSEHEIVREAARAELTEFTFKRYLTAFELLDPDVQVNTGLLVKHIDPSTIPTLEAEFKADTRPRTLRALEIITAIELGDHFEIDILKHSGDEDHFVRATAIKALGQCTSGEAKAVVIDALRDSSRAVRDAAAEAIERMELYFDADQADLAELAEKATTLNSQY